MNGIMYKNRSPPDNDYDEPNFYTTLGPVSENCRTYDELNGKNSKLTENPYDNHQIGERGLHTIGKKGWIIFLVVVLLMCILASVLTYFAVNYLKDAHQNADCNAMDCGIGQCPDERYGDNCENINFRVSAIRSVCPDGWLTYDKWCYKGFTGEKTWLQARDSCRVIGADLLSVHGQNEIDFLTNQFSFSSIKYWIGLNDLNKNGFMWSDGTSLDYTNWKRDEPNNFNDNEQCVHFSTIRPGQWNDNNCYMSLSYICQLRREPQCGEDSSWLYFNNSCYLLNPPNGTNSAVTAYRAREICRGNRADLAIIQTRDEYSFLLSQATLSLSELLWIGLYYVDRTGDYQWYDGTSPTFLTWNIGEPAMEEGSCAGILSVYGNWAARNCNTRQGYICERQL